MPKVTSAWCQARGLTATVVTMGGALEGVRAAGMADAIVDLRETGTESPAETAFGCWPRSQTARACSFVSPHAGLEGRYGAPAGGRPGRSSAALCVMLHLPRAELDRLVSIFRA